MEASTGPAPAAERSPSRSAARPGTGPDHRPALRRCVAVEPEAFASAYWGRAPLHCRAADFAASTLAAPDSALPDSALPDSAPAGPAPAGPAPAGPAPAGPALAGSAPAAARPPGFGDLFGTADADELLSRRGLRTPFLRVVRDGEVLPPHSYVGRGGAGAEVGDQVRDERILALFAQGATLVFQGLHRLWPPLIDFAGTLAGELSVPVGVNAYLTPAGSQGFASHYDTHDVFVLQVEGRKRWVIHEPVLADPLERQPHGGRRDEVAATAAGPPAMEVELAAGDTLYLPRGWLHSATAVGEPSLHLTLGLRALTRYALVEELLTLAAEEPALRAGFPLGFDPTDEHQLAGQLAGTLAVLREALREPDVAAVARRMRSRAWSASRPAPIRPLAQAAASEAVDPDTVVAPRAGLRWFLRTEPDAVILELPDRAIRFPAFCGPAVRAVLAAAAPVRVGDLPDLDGEDQVVLVRRLLREAVAVPAGSA